MTYLDKQIAAAAASLGLQVQSTPQARNSQPSDGRPACCGNSMCIPMCPIGAKYDAAVHAKKAQAAGAQIIDRAIASFIEIQPDGSVGGIRFKRPDQTEQRAVGKVYVIAAHAIETPKLLLMSRADGVPNGVGNSSDQVGRNLMDHPTQLSWALANAPLYPYRGPLATRRSAVRARLQAPLRGRVIGRDCLSPAAQLRSCALSRAACRVRWSRSGRLGADRAASA
jgi:glucose dehydrogenase